MVWYVAYSILYGIWYGIWYGVWYGVTTLPWDPELPARLQILAKPLIWRRLVNFLAFQRVPPLRCLGLRLRVLGFRVTLGCRLDPGWLGWCIVWCMVWCMVWYLVWYLAWHMVWYMVWYVVYGILYGIWHGAWYGVWYGMTTPPGIRSCPPDPRY